MITIEQCLCEQMLGDLLFEGINGWVVWSENLCLLDVMIRYGIEE